MTVEQLIADRGRAMEPDERAGREAALLAEMDRGANWFPEADTWTEEYQSLHLPLEAGIVSPELASDSFRCDVVRRLVETAAAIARNKPSGAGHARVAAIIDWPLLVGSEICVFFDRAYERGFAPEGEREHGRSYWPGGWVSSRDPEGNLFDQLDIPMPDGFAARGIALTEYSKDTDHTYRYERWVAMETLERIA